MRVMLKADGPTLKGSYHGVVRGRQLHLKAGDVVDGLEVGPLLAAYPHDFEILRDEGTLYMTRVMKAAR